MGGWLFKALAEAPTSQTAQLLITMNIIKDTVCWIFHGKHWKVIEYTCYYTTYKCTKCGHVFTAISSTSGDPYD
jgi:hypothetical protein